MESPGAAGCACGVRASAPAPAAALSCGGNRDVTFTQPDAQPIRQPTPRPIIGIAGEIYQTPRINVNIVHARCSDGMSDRVYPDKVQVTVDGRRFDGCGGL